MADQLLQPKQNIAFLIAPLTSSNHLIRAANFNVLCRYNRKISNPVIATDKNGCDEGKE